MILTAISPRLAISTFENIGGRGLYLPAARRVRSRRLVVSSRGKRGVTSLAVPRRDRCRGGDTDQLTHGRRHRGQSQTKLHPIHSSSLPSRRSAVLSRSEPTPRERCR